MGVAKDIACMHYSNILNPVLITNFLKILFAHTQMMHV
jgi:hypothetical protein